jgi:biopolymer transport protein ExbD
MSIRKRLRSKSTEAQLDLTAFMNLMVIMIPSLLINAVFTQVNVLNVDQLTAGGVSDGEVVKPPLTLDVIIYADKILINNRGHGLIREIPGHDFALLNRSLVDVKKQYPAVSSATLRIDEIVPYQDIVSTIDAVRIIQSQDTGNNYALFPNVQLAGLEVSL